ncbi:DUF2953 domain-containing protein [Cohnella fermenti]|uniref:DUF2953 domain-containing protein n=1 Tax=Cohnella fermenti TaxID=2565925 RepID=A0A4S4BTS7_9BACL|nr:DUF2953 domain-containing protein [Cohnella fermenti]THF78329.1 DUF2953 domain-containing protein [Cohnella fermenti]
MAFWLWIGGIFAAVLLLSVAVLLSSVRVRIRYSRSGKLDQLVIIVRALYGAVQTQRTIPTIAIKGWGILYEEKQKAGAVGAEKGRRGKRMIGERTVRRLWKAFRNLRLSISNLKEWALETLQHVECTRWRIDVRLGTGNAAHTAVLSGLCWTLMGCINGAASRFVRWRTHPHGKVEPVYSGKEFSLVWEADFLIRVSSLVSSLIGLGTRTIKPKAALRAWRTWKAGPGHV